MSIGTELERRINKQRTFARSFTPGEVNADVAEQFADFYSSVVNGGEDVRDSICTVVRELVDNAFAYAHGERVDMEMHIGPEGVMVIYSDTGGFYPTLEICDLFAHFKGEGGLARIAKSAEVNVDLANGILRCVNYGSLSLRQTREHELAKSPR